MDNMENNRSSDLEADSRPGSPPLSPREGSAEREESQGQRMEGADNDHNSMNYLTRDLADARARIVELLAKGSGQEIYIKHITRTSLNRFRRLKGAEKELWNARRELEEKNQALSAQKKENQDMKNRLNEVAKLMTFMEKCHDKYTDFEGLYRDSKSAMMMWNDGTSVGTVTGVATEVIRDYTNAGVGGSSNEPVLVSATASFPNRSSDSGDRRKSLPKKRKINVVASEDSWDDEEAGNDAED